MISQKKNLKNITNYGYNKNLKVADKSFSCSIRHWDFSDVFGYSGAIRPDISVVNGVKDREKGIDRQLQTALEFIKEKGYNRLDKIENSTFKL